MWLLTTGSYVLLACCVLLPGLARGQQSPSQTKVPAMTSDDPQGGWNSSRSAPAPGQSRAAVGGTPAGWVRYFPANCGLSIALPRRPLEADLPISEQDKGLFRSSSNSFYTDGSLTVMAAHFQTVTPTPASSIVDSFFESLSENKEVRNLRYSANPGYRPTRTDLAATYTQGDKSVELEGFIEVTGTHGWLVLSMHRQGSAQAKEKGRRVLESALFDGPSCVD